MATIKDVKTKIQNANALGIANLTEQGVELSADATTYEIMQGIAEIVSGGGSQYTSIVYNEDNTITLTDKDGVIHTMECEYTDGKLTSVKYDGKSIALFYDEDVLVKVGKTEVDMANAPTEMGALEALIDESGVLEESKSTATEKVEELIEKAENENLWYKASEKMTNLANAFVGWEFETLPRMNPIKVTGMGSAFYNMPNVKRIDFYLNTENATKFNTTFGACPLLEYIKGVNTSKATLTNDMFSCSALKIIEEPFDFSSHTTTNILAFRGALALVEIRFVPETIPRTIQFVSPNFSEESKQSIVDGLATVETTMELWVNSKTEFTDEQKATINEKGWSLVQ